MPFADLNAERHHILRQSIDVLQAVAREEDKERVLKSVLEGMGLDLEDLPSGRQSLGIEVYARAIEGIGERLKVPALGARLGRRKKSGTFGIFGIGMATGMNLAHTFRFSPWLVDLLWDHTLKFSLLREPGWAIARYESEWPSSSQAGLIAIEEVLLGCISVVAEVLPEADWSRCEVQFCHPAPPYVRRYEELFPCPVTFDQRENQLRFPIEWLDCPLTQANRTVADFCESVCQELLASRADAANLQRQVRELLRRLPLYPHPSIADVARILGLSERTLRGRLSSEGASFRDILHAQKVDLAQRYLAETDLNIKEIAYRLGFSHLPSFYRVFCRDAGCTPEAFRTKSSNRLTNQVDSPNP